MDQGSSKEEGQGLAARLNTMLANLPPAYFGMVMATGIVSLASKIIGLDLVAQVLFYLNCGFYLILWVLSILRIIFHGRKVLKDISSHLRGPGFFTTVAGTSILGSQFIILRGDTVIAFGLWIWAAILWLGLTYAIFASLTVKEEKPPLHEGISGAWLLAVVATQSIAVLAALLAPHWAQPHRLEMNFLALSMWLCGGMLYIWMMSIIFYRYTFYKFSPGDLSPPYWINMGAMAISTLAGSLLIQNAPDAPFLLSLLPFIKGFSVFYWATGTWWIPMLLVLGVWRYVIKRFPVAYDPLYWGAVFPLGMYARSTQNMLEVLNLGFLAFLPRIFAIVAIAVWLLVFVGLLVDLVRDLIRSRRIQV